MEIGSHKWYNVLSEISIPKIVTKEESSDDSTVVSSQTSTLTRNEATDKDLTQEEHRTSDTETEVGKDNETSTTATTSEPVVTEEPPFNPHIVIKRSQTFTPSNKNFICKLNRSDSDSAMNQYYNNERRNLIVPFQRNTIERRSLRFRKQQMFGNVSAQHLPHVPRQPSANTTIDLELDLHAQKSRLDCLNDDLSGLKDVLGQLETAKKTNDQTQIKHCLQDERVQRYLMQAQKSDNSNKTVEELKVDKLLKKTSKDIYRLRKSKAGTVKPDVTTFKYVCILKIG